MYRDNLPIYYKNFITSNINVGNYEYETIWGIQHILKPIVKDHLCRLKYSPTPTINLQKPAYEDAMRLRNCLGDIILMNVLNDILPYRSTENIENIVREYTKITKKSLKERCLEIYNSYRYGSVLLVSSQQAMRAYILHYAFDDWDRVDFDSIVYILITHNEKEIDIIQNEFHQEYKISIVDKIKSKTNGYLQKALMAMIEKNNVLEIKSENILEFIKILIKDEKYSDEQKDKIIDVILKNDHTIVNKIICEYERVTSRKLEEKFNLNDPFEKVIRSKICYISDPARFYALHMHEGLKIKKFQNLYNVICLHYTSDMGHIVHAYNSIYPVSLVNEIEYSMNLYENTKILLLRLLGK